MESAKLIALKDELDVAISSIEPQIEGLEDFGRLNIQEEARAQITEVHGDFKRRLEKLKTAVAALEDLEEDGYPDLSNREVTEAIYGDLKEQTETLAAALGKFDIGKATDLGVTLDSPQLKNQP
jgi:hypothetical protein